MIVCYAIRGESDTVVVSSHEVYKIIYSSKYKIILKFAKIRAKLDLLFTNRNSCESKNLLLIIIIVE